MINLRNYKQNNAFCIWEVAVSVWWDLGEFECEAFLTGQSLRAERALGKAKIKWKMRDRSKERTSTPEVRSRKGSWVIGLSSGDVFCHDQHTDVPSCEQRLWIEMSQGQLLLIMQEKREEREKIPHMYVAGSCHSRGSCGKWSSSLGTRLAGAEAVRSWRGARVLVRGMRSTNCGNIFWLYG